MKTLAMPRNALSNETLQLAKDAFGALFTGLDQGFSDSALVKAGIALAQNLVGVNLEAPAKSLVPVYSPLRNRFARVKSTNGAKKVDWKAITDINPDQIWAEVAEGTRNTPADMTTEDRSATFKTLEMEGKVTFEAIQAARNFMDTLSYESMRTLWNLMIREEYMILGGNVTAIGAPTNPAGSNVAGGVAFGAATYKFKVSALVLKGLNQKAKGKVAGVDAVGETDPSAATADVVVGGGEHVVLTWDDVIGAVAYNVYAKKAADPNYTYQKTVYVNKWTSDAAYVNTGNLPNAADQTGIATQYDGLISDIQNGVTGTDQYQTLNGGKLTKGDGATIKEFETVLRSMWDNFLLGPTAILMNSEQFNDVTAAIVGTSAPAMRVMLEDGEKNLIGGVAATGYLNKYASEFAEGVPQIIPMKVHPFLPKGTIIFLTEQVPYPLNNVPNIFEIEELEGYTQRNFALVQRAYEMGVECMEVLKSYFPAAHGTIKNVAPGLN